jgi:hypothetical protein
VPERDPRLAGFAKDGEWDICPPSAALAALLEDASGPEWRCADATTDEMIGLLRQAQALESWAAAMKLGIARSLIRDDDEPLPAKAVHEAFLLLSDENAALAEALILGELPGKTYGQVKRLAEQAALTVDPDAAARRREDAEQHRCRVELFREESGAAALSGRDLPTDQTLAAHAHVCARAQQYKESGAFPDGAGMDQFRVAAYLDLLNGLPAETRIASGQLAPVTRTAPSPEDGPAGPGDDEPSGGGSPSTPNSSGPSGNGTANTTPPRLADLVLPLATLLGLAERPGEGHAIGPLDPDLCRSLAIAATGSPWTRLCVTVTDAQGIAIGHGCARPQRRAETKTSDRANRMNGAADAGLALPSQVNLTITAARLAELGAVSLRGPGQPWAFTQTAAPGPPGGHATWTLTLPDGRQFTVALEPMPTYECDHRHRSHAYQPNDRLRHVVQVRDYTCTFPLCSRNAKASDFEHAVPYDQGGPTCACNAGARSRACHQVKQSKGWNVTQPRPGWHHWQTPAGRVYIQDPKRYPT